jgi:hypothetical protein
MCALCGALGSGEYWTDAAGRPEFEAAGRKLTRRHERSQRVALVDEVLKPYGLSIRDWGGNSYVLRSACGAARNVYNLAGVWSVADELAQTAVDPLSDSLLRELEKVGT